MRICQICGIHKIRCRFFIFPKKSHVYPFFDFEAFLLGHFIKHKTSISEEFLELLPTKKSFQNSLMHMCVCIIFFFRAAAVILWLLIWPQGSKNIIKHTYIVLPSENFELLQIFKRRNALWFREGSKHRKTELAPQVLNFVRFDGKNHHGQQETGWRSVKENLPQKRVGSNSWRSCVR